MINIDTRLLDMVDERELWLLMKIASHLNADRLCWPSNKTLIKATGWSENKMAAVKKSLIDKGILMSRNRYREDGSMTSNLYRVTTEYIGVFVPINEVTPPQELTPPPPQKLGMGNPLNWGGNEVLTKEVLTNEQSLVVLANDGVVKKKKKKSQPAIESELQEKVNEVIGYLNAKTKKDYRPTTPDYIKHIKARFDDGYTMDDFKAVIDVKCEEWLNTPRRIYLRPNTLFLPGHFEDYRVQATFEYNSLPDPSAPHYQLAMHIQNTYPNLWSSNVRIFNAAEYADYQNNVTMKGMALQAADNKRKALAAIMAKLNEDYGMRQKYNSLFDAYLALAKTYLP